MMDITAFVVSKRNDSLLIGDYGSYRKALSRRLLTLRRRLGRTSPKGKKYVAKVPITTEDVSSNPEFLQLRLLEAERAWAHAMYMKSQHSAESDKVITGSARTHILSRLEKARKIATTIVGLLDDTGSNVSEKSVLEAQAYRWMMQGALQFEASKWEECLEAYSIVHVVYSVLTRSASTKEADIFKEILSSTIEPSIRYAAYQRSLPRTMPMSRIVAQHALPNSDAVKAALKLDPDALKDHTVEPEMQRGQVGKDLPKTITWRSRTVKLEDARIAQSLASVNEAEEKLADLLASNTDMTPQDKAAAYDDILVPSQDAVDATKTAIDELTSEGVPTADQRLQALQVTRTALNYALIGWRVGRNRILCGYNDGAVLELVQHTLKRKYGKEIQASEESNGAKLARLRERVVLYDSTLQSIDSIKELPGVAADQTLGKELESKNHYFSALRSLALARSHALLDRPQNALALFSRALSYASKISVTDESPSHNKPLNLELTSSQSHSLQNLLQRLVTQHRALAEVYNLQREAVTSEKAKKTGSTPFIERLDEYPISGVDLTRLVDYPPRLRSIPVKPIFLDVAWNYIDYPGRAKKEVSVVKGDRDEPKEEKKDTKKGWGWFGRSAA